MQVDQTSSSSSSSREMRNTDMVSQECVAGTSNVPPPAAAAATVDAQLPEVMTDMRIRDERNANREDKVSCVLLLVI